MAIANPVNEPPVDPVSVRRPGLHAFYRPLAARKAKKLALNAAMRKLLVVLNTILRNCTIWNSNHAAVTNR
jgi:hypothetical protein